MHLPLAYIDPGSGSLIIQVAIATLVSIPVIFRAQVARGVRAIRRDKGPATETMPRTDDPGHAG